MYMQRNRTLFSWLAILTILLNALAPAVTHALGQTGAVGAAPSAWLELCSTQGSTWVRLDPHGVVLEQTRQKPADAPEGLQTAHCPYCATHAASFGLLPPSAEAFALPAFALEVAPHPGFAAVSSVNWLVPAARAPPFQA
jgi:hypothetical protein